MCYKGKCLMCIPVEHGCLVLAILSAIGTGLSLLASVVSGGLLAAGVIVATTAARNRDPLYDTYDSWGHLRPSYYEPEPEAWFILGGIAMGIFILIVGVASLVAFIFSVLLCNGICKRRPGQVKAYFIYGITITVLAVLSAVGYLISNSREPEPGIITLFSCVIYSLFLVLVHQTHAKLQEGAMFKDHIRLVES